MAMKGNAGRYAQAVFELALERQELERWQSDLREIASLAADATLVAWLENPKVRFSLKTKLLSERLVRVSPLAVNLTFLLITKGRVNLLSSIVEEYQRRVDAHQGIVRAEVVTAVPLEGTEEENLAERLGAITGKKVLVKSRVDPEILGGLLARIDDRLLDGSTKSKLMALKQELAK